jgi:hypothetical protein
VTRYYAIHRTDSDLEEQDLFALPTRFTATIGTSRIDELRVMQLHDYASRELDARLRLSPAGQLRKFEVVAEFPRERPFAQAHRSNDWR